MSVLRGGREDAAQRQNLSEAGPCLLSRDWPAEGDSAVGKSGTAGREGAERGRDRPREKERRLQRQREYISPLGLP